MKISYKKLWIMLVEKEMSKQSLREQLEISAGTMTKLNKGEEVSLSTLLRICEFFDCNIGDICDAVKKNELK
jgi:DNA-binding Xre family transcriptional regulator